MQNLVKEFIEKKLGVAIVLEKPKDLSLGHYATPVAFSLAKELKEALLIIDELKGRKVAKELGITISGSLGVLLAAKNKGIISSVKSFFQKISETDFRLSEELIRRVLQFAKEE